VLLNYQIIARRKELFTPIETHELLKLHEKLDTLTKALHNLNLKAEVFAVDLDEHKTQVDEIKSEILKVLEQISQVWYK
jgi:chromosome segregation ATPase